MAYDAVGQLTRVDDETDTTSGANGTTWIYYYNNHGGNFSSKRRYPYTPYGTSLPSTYDERIVYTYGDSKWKDKLTKYNGVTITYDNIGNPLNDGTWTYTWQAGRQLAGMQKTGMTVAYAYDHNGLRTQKTVTTGGITTTTNYMLHGKLVTEMTRGTDKLHFFYDAQSRPAMVEYNGVMYTYIHNLQGDIVGILNGSGAVVVEYSYDAWGRATGVTGSMASSLGDVNPFRYRGYVYDEETGLYYLRSRYYNPVWQRFVNGDAFIIADPELLSNNLMSYCINNPVIKHDHTGFWFVIDDVFTGPVDEIIVAAIGFYISCCSSYIVNNNSKNGKKRPVKHSDNALWRNTEQVLTDIAGRYSNFECMDAANSISKYLRKEKQYHSIIKLYYPDAINGFVVAERNPNETITLNGTHYGIKYNGIVYCNIYPEGRLYQEWVESFSAVNYFGELIIPEISEIEVG